MGHHFFYECEGLQFQLGKVILGHLVVYIEVGRLALIFLIKVKFDGFPCVIILILINPSMEKVKY